MAQGFCPLDTSLWQDFHLASTRHHTAFTPYTFTSADPKGPRFQTGQRYRTRRHIEALSGSGLDIDTMNLGRVKAGRLEEDLRKIRLFWIFSGDSHYLSWSPLLATTFRGHCSKPMWYSTALYAILQEVEGPCYLYTHSMCVYIEKNISYIYIYVLQSIDLYSTLFHLKIRNVHLIHFDSFRCHSCIGTLPPHFHPPRNRWLQEVVAAHPASFWSFYIFLSIFLSLSIFHIVFFWFFLAQIL